jgi:hypothetical protein
MGTILDSIVRKRVDEGLLQLKKEPLYVDAEHQLFSDLERVKQQLPEQIATDIIVRLEEAFTYINQMEYYHLYEKGLTDGLYMNSELRMKHAEI